MSKLGPEKVRGGNADVHYGNGDVKVEKVERERVASSEVKCYGPPALYTFPTPYAFPASTCLMPLNPLPYLVHVPLFKSPHLTLIT